MMVFYPNEDNKKKPGGDKPGLFGFDLQAEKQRIAEATEEIKKELWEKWHKRYANAQLFPKKLSATNPELIEFLLSFKNTLFYNDLAKKSGFSQEQRDILPRVIWNISLAKNWYGLESLLQSELKINPSLTGQIAILLNQNILFKAKELGGKAFAPKRFFTETKEEQGTEKISIQEAIRKYPELGEQLITSERIIIQSFPSPVRPSVKNWLADYNFVMGYDRERSGIERTNYLFHNTNTQKLNPAEREKIAAILKSFDENYPLLVNKNTQQVVFPPMAAPRPTIQPIPRPVETARPQPVVPLPVVPPRVAPRPTDHPRPASSGPTTLARDNQKWSDHYGTKSAIASKQPPQPFPKPVFHTAQPSRPTAPLPQGKLEIKEPPHIMKQEGKNLHFTSPQTLPFEKDGKEPLQPHRIIPFGGINSNDDSPKEDIRTAKNIINLKE